MDHAQMQRIFRAEEKRDGTMTAINTIGRALLRDLDNRSYIARERNPFFSLKNIIREMDEEWRKFAAEVPEVRASGFRDFIRIQADGMIDFVVRRMFLDALRALPPIIEEN